MRLEDLGTLVMAIIAAVSLVVVVSWRRKDHAKNIVSLAEQEVCEHLKPALDHILASGCRITRAGQNHPDLPLEVHFEPPFDPAEIYKTLELQPPVYLSERNVLYCKEHWCELHPKP